MRSTSASCSPLCCGASCVSLSKHHQTETVPSKYLARYFLFHFEVMKSRPSWRRRCFVKDTCTVVGLIQIQGARVILKWGMVSALTLVGKILADRQSRALLATPYLLFTGREGQAGSTLRDFPQMFVNGVSREALVTVFRGCVTPRSQFFCSIPPMMFWLLTLSCC